jgi:hypothetical protein
MWKDKVLLGIAAAAAAICFIIAAVEQSMFWAVLGGINSVSTGLQIAVYRMNLEIKELKTTLDK